MEKHMNEPIKVEVGKRYIDKKNCVITIKSVTKAGWYLSNLSSYKQDGTCFHGSHLDLYKAL